MVHLRKADDIDWEMYFGRALPVPMQWYGYVADAGYMIQGIGGAYLGEDHRWWAVFSRAPGVALPVMAHRAARMTIDDARSSDLLLHAIPDPRINTAKAWLTRLAFQETHEQIGGLAVWVQK